MECPYKPICKDYSRADAIIGVTRNKYRTAEEIKNEVSIALGSLYRILKRLVDVGTLESRKRKTGNRRKNQSKWEVGIPVSCNEYKLKK